MTDKKRTKVEIGGKSGSSKHASSRKVERLGRRAGHESEEEALEKFFDSLGKLRRNVMSVGIGASEVWMMCSHGEVG